MRPRRESEWPITVSQYRIVTEPVQRYATSKLDKMALGQNIRDGAQLHCRWARIYGFQEFGATIQVLRYSFCSFEFELHSLNT